MNIILFDENELKKTATDTYEIDKFDFRAVHLQQVLHLKIDDTFIVGFINKAKYTAKVLELEKAFSFVLLTEEKTDKLYPVVLAVSQVRPICMKRILRESVSLGIEELALISTDTGEKSYRSSNLYTSGEYKKYLLNGAMQSGSPFISKVEFYDSVDAFLLETSIENCQKIVLDNTLQSKSLAELESKKDEKTILAIGGERGWSDRERNLFKNYSYDFRLIGNRILRTETACDVGLGLLLARKKLL